MFRDFDLLYACKLDKPEIPKHGARLPMFRDFDLHYACKLDKIRNPETLQTYACASPPMFRDFGYALVTSSAIPLGTSATPIFVESRNPETLNVHLPVASALRQKPAALPAANSVPDLHGLWT